MKRLVGISVFLSFTLSCHADKEEDHQTANVDRDVLGQFWHKKSEKEKRWKWNVGRRNKEAKQEKIQETNRTQKTWSVSAVKLFLRLFSSRWRKFPQTWKSSNYGLPFDLACVSSMTKGFYSIQRNHCWSSVNI